MRGHPVGRARSVDARLPAGLPEDFVAAEEGEVDAGVARGFYIRTLPTATTLPDGRVLVTSGATTCITCLADVPEVYDPVTNTGTQLTSAPLAIPYYPLAFVLPDGKVLVTGSTETATVPRTLDLATQTWTTVDSTVVDGSSGAMFLPGKVLQSGTASDPAFVDKTSSTATAVLDMTQSVPAWRRTPPMAFGRAYNNLVVLPDGSVLAVGGGSDTNGEDVTTAVYAAERWSPATETWATMASSQVPRLYHSTALLLLDGRVLVAGGGEIDSAPNQTRAEYYSPPYLFRGDRPELTTAPDLVAYGSTFFVGTPDAASIGSVALIRTGATTHAFDENQRFVPLTFAPADGGLTLTAPADANIAPPGHYLLFLVNTDGVPSIARFVRFAAPYEASDTEAPSAPSSLSATGSVGSADLTWTAATDNVGVAGYNVHRSSDAGFTPTSANLIAQPTTTSYTDSGLAAGTYYYLVTARDAAGNISAPSNEASATATDDTTAPAVTITSPAAGATVFGTITVTADASDNVGVIGVQFLVDDAALGTEDMTAPYGTPVEYGGRRQRLARADRPGPRRGGEYDPVDGGDRHGVE
jgi:galactose oxidase-like protein/Big-like domain-containing protein